MQRKYKSCVRCDDLRSSLFEKEKEIRKLKLHIKNLTNFLLWNKTNCGDNSDFSLNQFHSNEIENSNQTESLEKDISSSDLINLSCEILNINKHYKLKSKSVQTDFTEYQKNIKSTIEVDYQETENADNEDYVYDSNYQMYYNSSTGYYYDEKSGLMYEPHSRTYYKYNYDLKVYEKVTHHESVNSGEINGFTSETVHDQASNLNLDEESLTAEKIVEEIENVASNVSEGSINENESSKAIDFEKIKETEVSVGSAKDWQCAEGSALTVTDMVKQVVDEYNNVSDYTFDETYQMYYSPSTGYYYDAVRKLLYDPSSGIYYFYDEIKQKYEFYCQVDPNSSDKGKSSVNKISVIAERLKCRKMFWKKKIEYTDQFSDSLKDSDKGYGDISEEEYSSPEEGEVFSSDEDSNPPVSIVRSPISGTPDNQKCDSFPPSIRAIVENSEKLKIGSLILITCSGGIIGRDKTNAIYLPDISISKAHAEIKYNTEFQTYSIEDLGSQNGTFINDKRLSEPKLKSDSCTLNHGDKLSLGSFKLLLHIHEGYETCDNCEPGQVLAEISSNTAQTTVHMTKEEREKQRREEIQRLKKKYGLKGANFERKTNATAEGYEDKAEIRRKTVGSDNPYEKTEEASVDVLMPESNKGYQMLKKMGWKEGQSLGTADSGLIEPIPLRPWTSKAGLGSSSPFSRDGSNSEDRKTKRWVKAQERYFQLSLGSDPP